MNYEEYYKCLEENFSKPKVNEVERLQRENQQLKEKIKLRNKEKTDICNKLENQNQIIKRYKNEITNLISKNKKIKCQVQQRDEVIDEAIELIRR